MNPRSTIKAPLYARYDWANAVLPLAIVTALFNALLPAMLTSIKQGVYSALSNGMGHSFVIWFCLLLAARSGMDANRLLFTPTHREKKGHTPTLFTLLLLPLIIIPSATLSWVLCAVFCLIWLQQTKRLRVQRVAALIILAIAVRDPACQFFLNMFADQILSFDAWLSGLLLHLSGTDFYIDNNTISQANGYSLLILTGCSAFHNLSLALLLWLSLSLYSNQQIISKDYVRSALLVLVVLGINGTRLALMAINNSWYLYLHDGNGALLIDALIVLQTLLFVRRPRHEQKTSHPTQKAHLLPAIAGYRHRAHQPNNEDR